jgi:5-dehydro-2-deoxygluconokinase
MGRSSKYIGGSPTNIACGTARLGLESAVITGVGDEHMGRYIVEQLARGGVDTRGVKVDPERLTTLVPSRHPRRRALPADLLPREPRRDVADRG